MRSRSPLALLLLAACSGEDAMLEVPAVESDYIVYGTAPVGRALSPSSVRIVEATGLATLEPERIAGTDVDMFFAGLDADDLPADLTPLDLEIVASNDERARPLPMLHAPHVMDVPSPAEAPTPLVPVTGPSVGRERSEERDARLRALVADIAIASPCVELAAPFRVTTPRLPIDSISEFETASDGATMVGFASTSTIFVGFVAPGTATLDARPVPTGTVALVPGERVTLDGFGDDEVTIDGARWPAYLAITYTGRGFGSIGALLRYDAARRQYVDDTPPIADTFPRVLYGAREVTFRGVEQLCTYGGAQGADRRAALWCRPAAGGPWTAEDFGTSFGVTSIVARDGAPPIVTDLTGAVWELGDRGWRRVFEASVNAGCEPLCANFAATWFDPSGDGRFAVLGASKAQLLFVEASGTTVTTFAPPSFVDALFVDERFGSEAPLQFTAVTVDPNGAVWVATKRPELFRIRESEVERICLPKVLNDVPITAIEARADGRLFLGATALFVDGDWR